MECSGHYRHMAASREKSFSGTCKTMRTSWCGSGALERLAVFQRRMQVEIGLPKPVMELFRRDQTAIGSIK